MTKEEKQRGLELQDYIDSVRDMTIKEIAIKYLKEHHLPKFLAGILVKFSYPLLLAKDYESAKLEKENAELKSRDCWKSCEYANSKAELIEQHIKDVQNLSTAKEIIKKLKALYFSPVVTKDDVKRQDEILENAEQFLNSEVEK